MTRFSESPAPGVEFVYEGEFVHAEDSAFQHIDIYEHPTFGRTLVLDGAVQTSERDEFLYHEMLVHVPLLCHPEPRRVLVIGGGDGGTLRRVLEHPTVTEAVMVEIDERVTVLSREYMPSIGGDCWDDPRATVLFDDGNAYVHADGEAFDAIIVDSSDPVGPGVVLFETPFYKRCLERLNPGGVYVAQVGSPIYFQDEVRMAVTNARVAFGDVRPYLGHVTTYPGVAWAFMLCGERLEVDPDAAAGRATDRKIETRYWTPEVHTGAFAIPGIVRDAITGDGRNPFGS
ncbi:MAG: polyamine aminopropyltransferase [Actinomycetota bacterium]